MENSTQSKIASNQAEVSAIRSEIIVYQITETVRGAKLFATWKKQESEVQNAQYFR